MEKDTKIVLSAVLLLIFTMVSFSFFDVTNNDITGKQVAVESLLATFCGSNSNAMSTACNNVASLCSTTALDITCSAGTAQAGKSIKSLCCNTNSVQTSSSLFTASSNLKPPEQVAQQNNVQNAISQLNAASISLNKESTTLTNKQTELQNTINTKQTEIQTLNNELTLIDQQISVGSTNLDDLKRTNRRDCRRRFWSFICININDGAIKQKSAEIENLVSSKKTKLIQLKNVNENDELGFKQRELNKVNDDLTFTTTLKNNINTQINKLSKLQEIETGTPTPKIPQQLCDIATKELINIQTTKSQKKTELDKAQKISSSDRKEVEKQEKICSNNEKSWISCRTGGCRKFWGPNTVICKRDLALLETKSKKSQTTALNLETKLKQINSDLDTAQKNKDVACKPCTSADWSCTLSPTICPSSGIQTRTCTKTINCLGDAGKPAESQICALPDIKPEPKIYLPDELTLAPDKNIGFTIADLSKNYDIKKAELFLRSEGKEDLKLNTRINTLDLELVAVSDVLWEVVKDYQNIKEMGFGKYNFVLKLIDKSNKESETELPIELLMDKEKDSSTPESEKTGEPKAEQKKEDVIKTEVRTKEEIEDQPPAFLEDGTPPPLSPPLGCTMELKLAGDLDSSLAYPVEAYGVPSPDKISYGSGFKLGRSEGEVLIGPYKGNYRFGYNFEIHAKADPETYKEGQWSKGTITNINYDGTKETKHIGIKNSNDWDGDSSSGYDGNKWGNDDYKNERDSYLASSAKEGEKIYRLLKVKEHKPGIIHWVDVPGNWGPSGSKPGGFFDSRTRYIEDNDKFVSIVWKEVGNTIVDYCYCKFEQHIEVKEVSSRMYSDLGINPFTVIKNEMIHTGGVKCTVV